MTRAELVKKFALLMTGNQGIESLITETSHELVIQRLLKIDDEPLSKVQFNQLLGLASEIGVSDGVFQYYWLSEEPTTFDVQSIPDYDKGYAGKTQIESIAQLYWGLYRLWIDGLWYNGNVRAYFRRIASLSLPVLNDFFKQHQVDTQAIRSRGPSLPMTEISRDKRYLISEMACKSYGTAPETESELKNFLIKAFRDHKKKGGGKISVRNLLTGDFAKSENINQLQFTFSADDILDAEISTESDIDEKYVRIARDFVESRTMALENTAKYLSLVNDLDVYVATSMRSRDDFREMADTCDNIFRDARIKSLHLRHFDPTLSAADGHQDKGLIECLMVKCARVLIYCAGAKESYGKDAEAAMSLSLGKYVIFFCSKDDKVKFYKDVHPLSRLINFDTGVAVGALVTDKVGDIALLLQRIYENTMQYELLQPKPRYLHLSEKRTGSIVRIQTNDRMLAEAFWNYYRSTKGTPEQRLAPYR
jgi:hypothetical protein